MLDNISLKSKVALLGAGALMVTAAIGGGYAARTPNPVGPSPASADLLVTGDDTPIAEVSDLLLDVHLSSPKAGICKDWLNKTQRLAAGCPLTATIVVTNQANEPATHVLVTAPQPKGWENPVVSEPATGCSLAQTGSADLVCDLGTLAPGASTSIVVEGNTAADADTSTLSAVVTVESDGIDTTPESSAEAAILRIVPQADLAVTLTPGSNTLVPGEPTTFTATVTNNGPSVASGVRIYQAVTDPLSADFTDVSVVTSSGAPDGTCKGEFEQNDSTARCKVDTLAPGESATMTVTGTIASDIDQPGKPIEVTVGVSSDTADTDISNNNAATSVSASASAAALMIGTTGPRSVAPGERNTWTMTVEDGGPSDSPNTRVDLTIPANLTNVVVTSDHGACDLSGCDLGTLLASVEVDMPGNTANIAITGTVDGSLATTTGDPGTLVLIGKVHSSNSISGDDEISSHGDGVWESEVENGPADVTRFDVTIDGQAVATADDEPQADIVVSGFAITPLDPTYTGPGSLRNITFTVTNNGPDRAHYPWFNLARSTDATTDLVDYPQAATRNVWIEKLCQTTPREIMCALTDGEWLEVGQSVTVDYNIALARMGHPGNYTDYLYAYSQTHDPDEANNYAMDDIVIGEGASALKLTTVALGTVPNLGSPGVPGSTANPDNHQSFVAGDQWAYQTTVEVPAADMADATGVTVTFELPPGFTTTSARTASGQCQIGDGEVRNGTVTCQIPVVAAVPTASSTQITLSGHVDDNANDLQFGAMDTDAWAENVPFTVTATSETPTKDGSPNTATTTTYVDIIESADLELFVTPDQAGNEDPDTVGYTLFALNLGPSGVEHAAFTAVIPQGYEFDAAASHCIAPTNAEMDLDEDDVVDLVPTTTGFTVGQEDAVVCKAQLMRSETFGALEAGQAGWARIVLKQIPGAATYGPDVEIVAGSLAPDPDASNNALRVSTTPPTRVVTLSVANPNGAALK